MKKPLIMCVVGPTASGKSELAVKLAKKFNGEIISVDSRQIYRGFDIGAGKVEGEWKLTSFPMSSRTPQAQRANELDLLPMPSRTPQAQRANELDLLPMSSRTPQALRQLGAGDPGSIKKVFIYKNIPHYLIDEASPKVQYSVSRFKKNATKKIQEILSRGKLPILCGGTMHWMDAVVFDQTLPEVKPSPKLRKQLEKLTTDELYSKLNKLDAVRSKTIDPKNPRRLIRALEIVMSTGKPVPLSKSTSPYNPIWIGINPGMEVLEKKIKKRLEERIKQGMIKEIESLHRQGLSWKKLESFGLEYKFCALFLQNKISHQELEEQLYTAIRQYAKRQLTWWKRNKGIHWDSKPTTLLTLVKKLLEC